MGYAAVISDDEPFEEKIKTLADEELLEIWVETQKMEVAIMAQLPNAQVVGPNFEEAIVAELNLRNSRRRTAAC